MTKSTPAKRYELSAAGRPDVRQYLLWFSCSLNKHCRNRSRAIMKWNYQIIKFVANVAETSRRFMPQFSLAVKTQEICTEDVINNFNPFCFAASSFNLLMWLGKNTFKYWWFTVWNGAERRKTLKWLKFMLLKLISLWSVRSIRKFLIMELKFKPLEYLLWSSKNM